MASTKYITATSPDAALVKENLKPSYQLNNTIELQTLSKERGNVKLRSADSKPSKHSSYDNTQTVQVLTIKRLECLCLFALE